ncbi:MAG TPA: 3-hydroxyacyl-CoA dehydrogenase [Eubacteriaceae bacterium]|nr:3-hydroxyacyl-CoA dehydrogenase [Eubacteriaceae bacterium]
MNDSAYGVVFSQSVDRFLEDIGLDEENRNKHNYGVYTLENHICYLKEAHKDQSIKVDFRVLDYDAKRIHCFLQLKDEEGDVLATSEQMLMGMDTKTGKPGVFPDWMEKEIGAIYNGQKQQHPPEQVGRTIGIRRKK